MNTDYDITLLEKYFDRELTENEMIEFQDRLLTDMSFKALVDKEKVLVQQIRQAGLQKDLRYLETLEKNLSNPKSIDGKTTGLFWRYAIAAAIVGILITVGVMVYSPKESSEELFQAYFKPYTNVFDPTKRGSKPTESTQITDSTQRSKAFKAYDAGDYQKAADHFTRAYKEKPEAGVLLLLGNCNLILNNTQEAEKNFNTLYKDFDELDIQAKWFLSLCYLKDGDIDKARKELNELGETEVFYAEKAKELLKKELLKK
jgi:tetratricopeptide (TPR) repeat protein